jgi:hypothetical protein
MPCNGANGVLQYGLIAESNWIDTIEFASALRQSACIDSWSEELAADWWRAKESSESQLLTKPTEQIPTDQMAETIAQKLTGPNIDEP